MQEGKMMAGRRSVVGRNKISIRVLLSQDDYEALEKIADLERTDIGTLVRRAVAHYFFMPDDGNTIRRKR